jgi:oligopeptidase B
VPSTRVVHGESVGDDYAWMRDVADPRLLDYLKAENAYADEALEHLRPLREQLFADLVAVLPEDDVSAPHRRGEWLYYRRTRAGQQYAVHCRRPVTAAAASPDVPDPDEHVLLDENELGGDYVEVGVLEVSPDGRRLAYSLDRDGNEQFELRVRDLDAGADLPDVLTGTYYTLAWAADSNGFLYTTLDAAHRPGRVWAHRIGAAQTDDRLVWDEPDRRFELWVEASRSGALLLLTAENRDTTEVRWLPADDLDAATQVVAPRRPGITYTVEHQGERLLVVADDRGPQFRLVQAPLDEPGSWSEVIAATDGVRIESAAAFADHVVVSERAGGEVRLRVLDRDDATVRLIRPADRTEAVHLHRNEEYDARAVRIVREGWVRPRSSIDHAFVDGAETVVHTQRVNGDGDYSCIVVTATAEDGTEIPLTLIERAGRADPGPCLLRGYGAYESSYDPALWPELRPLLDRGVLIAFAHVRGGGELGRDWWLQGRLLRKRNTFTDFVACAEALVDGGRTTPDLLAVRGMSAGGLLIGAVLHLAPQLFGAALAEVPFVDVVTTMLDDTIPLTVNEWDEWGDPRNAEHYAYLRGYSPYENLPGPRRPALLVTASQQDSRVSVHEPAKWVAKMRAETTYGEAPLLLHTLLGTGAHAGPAGRYDALRHEALLQAFLLDALGVV